MSFAHTPHSIQAAPRLGSAVLVGVLVLLAHAVLLMWLGAQVQITRPIDLPPTVVGALIEPERKAPVSPPVSKPEPPTPKAQASQVTKPSPPRVESREQSAPSAKTAVEPSATSAPTNTPVASPSSAAEPASRPAPPVEQQTVIPPRQDATSLSNAPPAYPALSRRMGEEGRVLLDVYILTDGSVGELKLKKSSGSVRLDEAAMKAVKNWKYIPAKQGGQAIAFWYVQPVSFVLNNP